VQDSEDEDTEESEDEEESDEVRTLNVCFCDFLFICATPDVLSITCLSTGGGGGGRR